MTILLGKGNGTFAQATNSPISTSGPNSVAVADFNEDGVPDLAVANIYSGSVTILLGKGDGTFAQAPSSPVSVGGSSYSVAAGDFNGDGIPDLAVASNGYPGQVSIVLGNGNGTFTQAANSPVTATTVGYFQFLAVGDFNGDGVPDLAAPNTYNQNGDVVSILLTAQHSATASVTGISVAGLGPHQAVASYSGDSYYNSSVSGTTPLYGPTPAPRDFACFRCLHRGSNRQHHGCRRRIEHLLHHGRKHAGDVFHQVFGTDHGFVL